MSLNEQISTGNFYRRCIDVADKIWERISFWTKASDVEFNDGMTAEEKVGAIKGVTTATDIVEEGYAADATTINTLTTNLVSVTQDIATMNESISDLSEKTASIKGITTSLDVTEEGYASDAKTVSELNNRLNNCLEIVMRFNVDAITPDIDSVHHLSHFIFYTPAYHNVKYEGGVNYRAIISKNNQYYMTIYGQFHSDPNCVFGTAHCIEFGFSAKFFRGEGADTVTPFKSGYSFTYLNHVVIGGGSRYLENYGTWSYTFDKNFEIVDFDFLMTGGSSIVYNDFSSTTLNNVALSATESSATIATIDGRTFTNVRRNGSIKNVKQGDVLRITARGIGIISMNGR